MQEEIRKKGYMWELGAHFGIDWGMDYRKTYGDRAFSSVALPAILCSADDFKKSKAGLKTYIFQQVQ